LGVEPRWVSPSEVIVINQRMVDPAGHPHRLLSQELLEAACFRPANAWHYVHEDNVLELAGLLMFGLAKNHPFQDGNKRTGFTAGVLLMQRNGYDLAMPDDVAIADAMCSVISGEMEPRAFLDILEPYVVEF
jgi:death-on-curing protein